MSKERKDMPMAIREKVLKEFSHRCGKWGSDNPQLHHMESVCAIGGIVMQV